MGFRTRLDPYIALTVFITSLQIALVRPNVIPFALTPAERSEEADTFIYCRLLDNVG